MARRAEGDGDNTPVVPVSIADVLRDADLAFRDRSESAAETSMPSVMVDPCIGDAASAAEDEGQVRSPSDRRSHPGGRKRAPWADADTMLIPKAMLDERSKPASAPRKITNGVLAVALAVLLLGAFAADQLMNPSKRGGSATAQVEDKAPAATAAAPKPTSVVSSTTILSDPPGAEVVHDGAIIGNTPVAVPRLDNEGLYLVRYPAHAPQLVKVGSGTGPSVRVILQRAGTE